MMEADIFAQDAVPLLTQTPLKMDHGKQCSLKAIPTATTANGKASTSVPRTMKALIDLDPLVYNYADCRFPDGNLMPAYMAEKFLLNKIEDIVDRSGASSWRGFLTFGPDNFRLELGTIRPYKGNRDGREKPPLHDHLRSFLTDLPNVQMVFGQEADDMLSIIQWEDYDHRKSMYYSYIEDDPIEEDILGTLIESLSGWQCSTIICSPDKDLDMVPGWHYRWGTSRYDEILPWFQDEISGLRCFYKQCLIGDTVDNIPGLTGVGPKSAHVAKLSGMDTELEMCSHVLELYEKWYGNYGRQFLTEVGTLLWMRRENNEYWKIPC